MRKRNANGNNPGQAFAQNEFTNLRCDPIVRAHLVKGFPKRPFDEYQQVFQMNRRNLTAAWLVTFVLSGASLAHESVIRVSPGNMQGWVIATNKGGKAELLNRGPAVFERDQPFVADDGRDLGKGAYYAAIGLKGDMTPPTAWLGLDTFDGRPLAGTSLKSITHLDYYAYNAHIPTGTSNSNLWTSWKLWWTYPRQLIQLQLTAQDPHGTQRKQFWFLPWQAHKIRGENSGRHCKKWLRYDPVKGVAPGPVMCARWFTAGPPQQEFASWSELVREYGDWTLVPTSQEVFADGGWKSAGWDEQTDPAGAPGCTATGTCLNFVVGARKEFAAVYDSDTVRWANDYRGFEGYVDWFTLGIGDQQITYDFEPAADAEAPKIVELSAKAAVAIKPSSDELVKLTGTVVDRTNAMFVLDDGSGTIIRGLLYRDIKTTENPVRIGERWSVWGRLQRVPFQPVDAPPLMWTCPSHMTKVNP